MAIVIPERLPVYKLHRPAHTDPSDALEVVELLLDAKARLVGQQFGRWQFSDGANLVDVDPRKGSFWMQSPELWVADPDPGTIQPRRAALNALEANRPAWLDPLAANLIAKQPLVDDTTAGAQRLWSLQTRVAFWDDDATPQRFGDQSIDVTFSYGFALKHSAFPSGMLQVLGQAAKCGIAIDSRGERLGINFAWSRLQRIVSLFDTLPLDVILHADRLEFESLRAEPFLAYRRFETETDAFLVPCVAVRRLVSTPDAKQFEEIRLLPATRFEEMYLGATPAVMSITKPVCAVRWPNTRAARGFVSWLGFDASGHEYDDEIKDDVLGALAGASWTSNDGGDTCALESNWTTSAREVTNAADLVYYVGHADATRLQVAKDAWLSAADMRLGEPRLKWLVVDACGPLQDDPGDPNGASVFKTWRPAFHGLRAMVGFASKQEQLREQGPRAMAYALEGTPLGRAWLRAAREHQPATNSWGPTVAAGLFALEGNTSSFHDVLPSDESSLGLLPGQKLFAIWVPLA